MGFSTDIDLQKSAAMVIALVVAIVGHEIMHGFIAYKFGDTTAKDQGRLSINPIKHIDPIGTIIVPLVLYFSNAGFLFGWAKPVPIFMPTVLANGGYLGAILVSLAGVLYNFALAIIGVIFLQGIDANSFLTLLLLYTISINIVLGIFNLYPLPPLDGFNVLGFAIAWLGFENLAQKLFLLSRYGLLLIVIIIATPISKYLFMPMYYLINLLLS